MADGHTCECSSKTGFPSSQNHSQISNSANTTRYNTEQDNLVVKSSLKLTWTGDFQSLKSFVCNNIKLPGEWTQPGGDKKVFTGKSFCITWRKGKKLLNFEGTDSDKIKRAFCIELCDMQEVKQVHQSVNSIDMCINSCPTTCKCRELSVDLEGVKLEQVISQNDIKVNTHNVGMLSDVVIDLKKQIHVMQEKLDNHVVSPNLYSKAVNCSTQTINTHYNECNNNARQRSEKLESDLSLFVKERSLEIEKLNLTIASLENKNAPTSAAPVNNNNSKINKNTLMNENNRNGHRNNGQHNNNGLNQCKSQNVSSQPFISAPVNNRDFDRVPLHDNRDLQNKALQVNQIANMPEKQPISDWIGSLPLIDIPTKVKNNQYSNGNTSNKPPFPKRHRMKTPPYRTSHRHQSLEWLSHLHLVHQLCKR